MCYFHAAKITKEGKRILSDHQVFCEAKTQTDIYVLLQSSLPFLECVMWCNVIQSFFNFKLIHLSYSQPKYIKSQPLFSSKVIFYYKNSNKTPVQAKDSLADISLLLL